MKHEEKTLGLFGIECMSRFRTRFFWHFGPHPLPQGAPENELPQKDNRALKEIKKNENFDLRS
jgi:hypothetical protein